VNGTAAETQPETQPEARPVPVALVGGLAEWGEVLLGPWRAALSSGVRVVDAPPHAALLGAAELATRTDLPHERLVHRVSGAPRDTDPLAVDGLPTEQVRPGLDDLDTRRAAEIVEVMLAAEAAVPVALAAAASQLAAAVDLAVDRMADGGRLIYVGAGTPGRLAALDAAECGPTFGVPPDRVIAVLAGGQGVATTSVADAEDDSAAGRVDLAAQRITPDDVVVGISASGRTPYVLGALAEAARANAATVAIVNNAGSPLAAAADISIEVLTGAEVIAGSTRLTAGTAQKIALNVLSTATMVRLGKTFGGWMVDVSPGNAKLRRRALRIIREAAGVDADTARRALDDAAGETPTALVALLLGVDTATARTRLAAAGGRVRAAIGS
jgi:N-acetylmuramic acid 6-phosphate etherase